MQNYKQLVETLRTMLDKSKALASLTGWDDGGLPDLYRDSANAIEELQKLLDGTEAGNGKRTPSESTTEWPTEDDAVNHPSHYTAGKVECIDALDAATTGLNGFEGYCTGNIIKYLWRWKKKNGLQDLEKAKWYLERLIKLEKEKEKCI